MTLQSFTSVVFKRYCRTKIGFAPKIFPSNSNSNSNECIFHFNFVRSLVNDSHLESLLNNNSVKKYLNFVENDESFLNKLNTKFNIIELLGIKKNLEFDMKKLNEMEAEGDEELTKLVQEERQTINNNLHAIKLKILENVVSDIDGALNDNLKANTEIQLIPAVGGDEAKIFALELFNMYMNYIMYKNWSVLLAEMKTGKSDFCGGGQIILEGVHPFDYLKYEGGVHRVQRVPMTEKMGRTHTSTCSVFVHQKQSCDDIHLKDNELEFQLMRSSGPGGQNVNKLETCVRLKHIPTGIAVECQESRYQFDNKKFAIQKLKNKLLEIKIDKMTSTKKALKKEQTGTNDYSDKIRTYHFTQNRVTDHRLNYTMHNLTGFLSGGKDLDGLILKLKEFKEKERILSSIEKTLNSADYKKFEARESGRC